MVHGYSIHMDIHQCIFNKCMFWHGYRMDASTRVNGRLLNYILITENRGRTIFCSVTELFLQLELSTACVQTMV